jgi:tRNA G18 (ribose-2'-O)-methylase SpoU
MFAIVLIMRSVILIAHNIRSCHNVGSLLRTAEGLGVHKVFLTGYTPYPKYDGDTRLPHLANKIHKQIAKTALGAEETQAWVHVEDINWLVQKLHEEGCTVAAVEQAPDSVPLTTYDAPHQIALLVGREVEGVEPEVLKLMDVILEIPMFGKKESFNVAQAAAMGLYHCTFIKP